MLCNKKKKNVKYCEIIQLKTSDYIRLQFYEVNLSACVARGAFAPQDFENHLFLLSFAPLKFRG